MNKKSNYRVYLELDLKKSINQNDFKKIHNTLGETYKKVAGDTNMFLLNHSKENIVIGISRTRITVAIRNKDDYEQKLRMLKNVAEKILLGMSKDNIDFYEAKIEWEIETQKIKKNEDSIDDAHFESIESLFKFTNVLDELNELSPVVYGIELLLGTEDVAFTVNIRIIPTGYELKIELIEVGNLIFDEFINKINLATIKTEEKVVRILNKKR